ncbi:MAG: short-chain fatty acid transporter [Deltaproteobacteria bacterium]|nr:MAG: short-chain fatty acid transporter [Deltaproteobacteria bacterium]
MIRRLADALSRWSARWVPDPFVIVILLTLLTVVLVWWLTGRDPIEALGAWGGRIQDGELLKAERGLWSLLAFAMQMCLTLVTGYALAAAPAVRRGIARLVDHVPTARWAIVVTALVAMITGLLNWGLGLIVGAILARDMGRSLKRRGIRAHYPLIGAAGYTGLLVWHGGLSGSAPLKITRASEIATVLPPNLHLDPLPLSETIGSPLNLTVAALLLVGVPLALVLMSPRDAHVREVDAFAPGDDAAIALPVGDGPARTLDRSFLLAALLAAAALGYLGMLVSRVGFGAIDLNVINLFFLAVGLLLHKSPGAYSAAIGEAARSTGGILLQFPFYAGIMGMMALTGLIGVLAHAVGDAASAASFGPLTFLSAGTVNLFVPSGGGQFAVQGPVVIEAAHQLGVPMGKAVMAFCYGDQWTNMLQPFWALPLLGITGLKVGDLIGYTAALMILVAPLFIVPLLLF